MTVSNLLVITVIALAAWCAVLTLLLVLTVRQISILTVRVGMLSPGLGSGGLEDDGPPLGTLLPSHVAKLLPEQALVHSNIILIAATCSGCRRLVEAFRGLTLRSDTLVLLAGEQTLGDALESEIPGAVQVLRDPEATRIAEGLGIQSTPFAITVDQSVVTDKGYVFEPSAIIPRLEENGLEDIRTLDTQRHIRDREVRS